MRLGALLALAVLVAGCCLPVAVAVVAHSTCRAAYAKKAGETYHSITAPTPFTFQSTTTGTPPNSVTCPMLLSTAVAENQVHKWKHVTDIRIGGNRFSWNKHAVDLELSRNAGNTCLFASVHQPGRVMDSNYCYKVGVLERFKADPENCVTVRMIDASKCASSRMNSRCERMFDPLEQDADCRTDSWDATFCRAPNDRASDRCLQKLQAHIATQERSARPKPWHNRRQRRYLAVQNNLDLHRLRHVSSFEPLVDGENYMGKLYDAIEGSSKRVFIAGWGFNPHLQLKRGADCTAPSNACKLRDVVRRAVSRRVEVRFLMWTAASDEMVQLPDVAAADLRSVGAKVVQHPRMWIGGTGRGGKWGAMLWSHHSKFAVVDDDTVFVGGIDLTSVTERFDRYGHPVPVLANTVKPLSDPRLRQNAGTNSWRKSVDQNGTPHNGNGVNSWPGTSWHDVAVRMRSTALNSDFARLFLIRQLSNNYGIHPQTVLLREDADFKTTYAPWRDLLKEDANPPAVLPSEVSGLSARLVVSLSEWSGLPVRKTVGMLGGHTGPEVDTSMWGAWQRLIDESENFIYVEQQYFISRGAQLWLFDELEGGPQEDAINDLGLRLLQRIARAHEDGKDFHVVIVLPYVADYNQASYMLRTINVFDREVARITGGRSKDYVNFMTLRGMKLVDPHADNNEADKVKYLDTMPIYVHDKVIITDSKVGGKSHINAIVGSANINDRSMVGDGDSETGVLLSDSRDGDNNEVWKLWSKLLSEHLKGSEAAVAALTTRPTSARNFKAIADLWKTVAKRNHDCFAEVLGNRKELWLGGRSIAIEFESLQRFKIGNIQTSACRHITGSRATLYNRNLFPDKNEFKLGFRHTASGVVALRHVHQRFQEVREGSDEDGSGAAMLETAQVNLPKLTGETDDDDKHDNDKDDDDHTAKNDGNVNRDGNNGRRNGNGDDDDDDGNNGGNNDEERIERMKRANEERNRAIGFDESSNQPDSPNDMREYDDVNEAKAQRNIAIGTSEAVLALDVMRTRSVPTIVDINNLEEWHARVEKLFEAPKTCRDRVCRRMVDAAVKAVEDNEVRSDTEIYSLGSIISEECDAVEPECLREFQKSVNMIFGEDGAGDDEHVPENYGGLAGDGDMSGLDGITPEEELEKKKNEKKKKKKKQDGDLEEGAEVRSTRSKRSRGTSGDEDEDVAPRRKSSAVKGVRNGGLSGQRGSIRPGRGH